MIKQNPNEIAIDLDYGTGWTHVGYIASELCKYLHHLSMPQQTL
jgi:hypothetical protein